MTKPPNGFEVRLAVLEERIRGKDEALSLQAKEYERRLLDLNHAHDKQVADQATYISEDKFEGFIKETAVWRQQVSDTLSELGGRAIGVKSFVATLIAIAALVISLFKAFHIPIP